MQALPALTPLKNRRLYTVFLMSITVCIVATLLISSYVYYVNYTRSALNQAYQSDLNSLTRTSKEVAGMTDSAQSLSFQIYRNGNISKLLYYKTPSIYDVTAAMGELANYLNSMPFIESVLVYNSSANLFYTAARTGQNGIFDVSELADKGILDILNRFTEYKPFTPIPRTYSNGADSGTLASAYTYLCYDAINRNQTINSAVIVNISTDWINKDITGENEPGQTFILDDQDRLLSMKRLTAPDWKGNEASLIMNRVKGKGSGYSMETFGGEKSLLSFTEPDPLGWQYVRITPLRTVTEQVSTFRDTTMTIAAVILSVGLVISWLLSGFLYVPIRRIMVRMNSLEAERRNNSETIKQNALRSLLLGIRTLSSEGKLAQLRSIGVSFPFEKDYRLLLLKIDRFQELKEARGGDLPVYKYAMMNISQEILSGAGTGISQVETVDMDDDSIVVLVSLSGLPPQGDDNEFRCHIREIRKAISDYLSLSVSAAYSPVTNQPLHLHPLYAQVKEAALHRMFCGHGCIIDSEDIVALKSKEYVYPLDKEKRMTEAIMAGRFDEAKSIFSGIVEETSHYPIHVMRLAISRLTMTINNLIYTIQKNGALEFREGLDIYMPPVESMETLAELIASFHAYFDDVRGRLVEKRSMKQGDLVRSINELIEKHYADPNLCLNWIADRLGMSSIYISRVYKQQTLNAIVDVINDIRLQKAKAHLEGSDSSIADIAEKTGYTSSSYFHRMFKKRFGITPSEYRKVWSPRTE